jgi:hypothetical protein
MRIGQAIPFYWRSAAAGLSDTAALRGRRPPSAVAATEDGQAQRPYQADFLFGVLVVTRRFNSKKWRADCMAHDAIGIFFFWPSRIKAGYFSASVAAASDAGNPIRVSVGSNDSTPVFIFFDSIYEWLKLLTKCSCC